MRNHLLLRSALCLMACLLLPCSAEVKHENFKVSVYVRAAEVQKMKDTQWLESSLARIFMGHDLQSVGCG